MSRKIEQNDEVLFRVWSESLSQSDLHMIKGEVINRRVVMATQTCRSTQGNVLSGKVTALLLCSSQDKLCRGFEDNSVHLNCRPEQKK
jgi:hypothetical protein